MRRVRGRVASIGAAAVAAGVVVAMVGSPSYGGSSADGAGFVPYGHPTQRYLADSCLLSLSRYRDYDTTGRVKGCGTKVSLSSTFVKLSVPHTWRTWSCPPLSERCKPDVLFSDEASAATVDFGTVMTTGGFEYEPRTQQLETVTVDFYAGPYGSGSLVGTITRQVDGNGGALLFAATATNGFASAVVRNKGDDQFAIARLRV